MLCSSSAPLVTRGMQPMTMDAEGEGRVGKGRALGSMEKDEVDGTRTAEEEGTGASND